jgi:hypothetical protein
MSFILKDCLSVTVWSIRFDSGKTLPPMGELFYWAFPVLSDK